MNAVIPNDQFRQRRKLLKIKKTKCDKHTPLMKRALVVQKLSSSNEFDFRPISIQCICPPGKKLSYQGNFVDDRGAERVYLEGRNFAMSKKEAFMQNPAAADHRTGTGRQVAFSLGKANDEPNYK
ncbi:hypothetical protein [Gynuella sp.]|uniref:hypothetical protein n=1 Tax=Gynuella sp. TaxID=2969146 RepID=UPI003D0C48C2